MRVLFLDGEDGSVGCRIHGEQQEGTKPRLSRNGTCECATRTLLRMKNLVAVRGPPGESMIGPADYYGNIEDAHLYSFTISIDNNNVPTVHAVRKSCTKEQQEQRQPIATCSSLCDYKWISGHMMNDYRKKFTLPPDLQLGFSLFPNPGMLLLPFEKIFLPRAGPGTDLSFFKARLVKNDVPFSLVSHKLRSADEFRLVSYMYEHGYAKAQTRSGGLFLEIHRFAQFITPLSDKCGGYVVLADRSQEKLCLIGVQIPFGWTLIIDEGAIHGDATLQGLFLMGMTSDHNSMQTADTVFLKAWPNYRNVVFATGIEEPPFSPLDLSDEARPITEKTSLAKVFNPFSRGYWGSLWKNFF